MEFLRRRKRCTEVGISEQNNPFYKLRVPFFRGIYPKGMEFMKNKLFAKLLSLLLATVLVVAMASCNGEMTEGVKVSEEISVSEEILTEVEKDETIAPEESVVSEESVELFEVSIAEESIVYVETEVTESVETSVPEESVELSPTPLKDTVLGEGDTEFTLLVSDYDGNETTYTIKTDKTILGEALEELNVIEGEEGAYGLYIKKVMGIRADYDLDGRYWAFYIDGSYATSGIDTTEVVDGESYALKVQK